MKFLGHYAGLVKHRIVEVIEGRNRAEASVNLAERIRLTTPLQVVVDPGKGVIAFQGSDEYVVILPYPNTEDTDVSHTGDSDSTA